MNSRVSTSLLSILLLAAPVLAEEKVTSDGKPVVENNNATPTSDGTNGEQTEDNETPETKWNKLVESFNQQERAVLLRYRGPIKKLWETSRDHKLTREEFNAKATALIRGGDAAALPIFKKLVQAYADMNPPAQQTRTSTPGNPNPTVGRDGKPQYPVLVPPKLNGDLADARTILDNANYRADPSNPRYTGNMGVTMYQAGDYSGAVTALNHSIENGNINSEVLTAYGASAYHLKDYDTARAAAEKALEMDPNNEAARAILKLAHDKPSEASVGSALAKAGLNAKSAAQMQALAQQIGDGAFGGAGGDALQAASTIDPVDQQRRAELAAAAAMQQVTPPSKIQQSAAITKNAEHSLSIGDYQTARVEASQAISLNNRNAQAWNFRAIANVKLGQYNDAVYDASYAIGLGESQAAPWATRSWAFSKQGKYKEGEYDARHALEKAPDNAYAYYDLSYALAGEGRREEALQALRLAAEKAPQFKPKLEQALQLAQNDDMTLLFADGPAAKVAATGTPAQDPALRKKRSVRLIFLSLTGGLLVALCVLHVVSASWRERVNATIRKVLARSDDSPATMGGAGPATLGAIASGGGFWEQYDLVREIGAGGMGLVYEARDRSLDRRVAVKKMRDEIRVDPAERARFVQEARTVAALHHPSIVEIYSIVEQDNELFLVFEYVQGGTLADRLRKGPMDFAETRRVIKGVAEAVEYAHKHKVIHRDIKPSNIMLSDEGQVKVMDFGVARQAKDAMTKMSMTNTVVGTPPYMAPEQEQGTVRYESDVFALGVVLFEMLTGKLPFAGVGAGMLLNKINGRFEVVSQASKQRLPAGIDEVLAKALCPDPDKRYKTPSELAAALDSLTTSVRTPV